VGVPPARTGERLNWFPLKVTLGAACKNTSGDRSKRYGGREPERSRPTPDYESKSVDSWGSLHGTGGAKHYGPGPIRVGGRDSQQRGRRAHPLGSNVALLPDRGNRRTWIKIERGSRGEGKCLETRKRDEAVGGAETSIPL